MSTISSIKEKSTTIQSHIYQAYVKDALDRLSEFSYYPLLIPGLLFLFVFFFLPMLILAFVSFQPEFATSRVTGVTLENYVTILSGSYFFKTYVRTFVVGVAVSVTTLVLGYPVAYHITRINSSRKRLFFMLLILVPYLTSVVVRTFGWLILLLRNGLLNNLLQGLGLINSPIILVNNVFGIYIGLVHVFLPMAVISLMTSLGEIEPELEKAAKDLGASRVRVFTNVLLPLSKQGLFGGFLLVFTLTVSSYTTPSLLGGSTEMMSTLIYRYVGYLTDFPTAAALAIILLIIVMVILGISNRLDPDQEGVR
jgi:putative spermidine/putrescine transport system permease protein